MEAADRGGDGGGEHESGDGAAAHAAAIHVLARGTQPRHPVLKHAAALLPPALCPSRRPSLCPSLLWQYVTSAYVLGFDVLDRYLIAMLFQIVAFR